MKSIQLYAAGSCQGASGPGGYGALLIFRKHRRELSGGYRITTNTRMELMAIIRGLEVLKEKCNVEVYSESKYVVGILSNGWAARWRANRWHRDSGEPAINPDLLGRLLEICEAHKVTFHWVGKQSSNPEQNRCEQLANNAAKRPGLPVDKPLEGIVHSSTAAVSPPPLSSGHKGEYNKAVKLVRRDLEASYSDIQERAVIRVGNENLKELAPDLLQVMESTRTASLKSRCAWALGKVNFREAEPSLIAALGDRSKKVRTWAAWALGEIGTPSTEAHLRLALDHEKLDEVRQAIGGALKKLNHDSTRVHESQLKKALQPPASRDPKLKALMDRLQQLEGTTASAEVVAIRAEMKSRNPRFFESYMAWVKRKPGLLAALQDNKRVFRN